MFVEGAPVIARCPLESGGSSEIFLTTQGIVIQKGGKTKSHFGRSETNAIRIRHRILWLPLVIGGIITPLALVALIKTFAAFWPLFLTVLVGLFLMYYGYTGTDALTITTRVKDYDFFVRSVTKHLRAFVKFVNLQLREDDPNIYISVETDLWEQMKKSDRVPEGQAVYLSRYDAPVLPYLAAVNAREHEVALKFELPEGAETVKSYLQKPLPFHLFEEIH
jgi:hypothetical protein